jgi:uncharacterized protein (DUF302 family)
MSYGHSVTLHTPFADTMVAVRDALAGQGFGIVSEVDMAATFRAKLGVETEAQVILGACRPDFALKALEIEASIGLLLPCNVVVRSAGDATIVEMIDPAMLVDVTGNADLQEIAGQVGTHLAAVMEALRTGA